MNWHHKTAIRARASKIVINFWILKNYFLDNLYVKNLCFFQFSIQFNYSSYFQENEPHSTSFLAFLVLPFIFYNFFCYSPFITVPPPSQWSLMCFILLEYFFHLIFIPCLLFLVQPWSSKLSHFHNRVCHRSSQLHPFPTLLIPATFTVSLSRRLWKGALSSCFLSKEIKKEVSERCFLPDHQNLRSSQLKITKFSL